jgi:superoxide reductase
MSIGSFYQTGDFKGEKHVPVIHAPEVVKKGEKVEVKVLIGEEIPHPNTLEHHISWIKLYFRPEGAKFPIELGTYDFNAHGESELFTEPCVVSVFSTTQPGTLYATSYCNIHGLWENALDIKVE